MAIGERKARIRGVDATANVVVTYHQQFMSASFIRQHQTESMEDYLKRFNALVTTVKLVGGDNIWNLTTFIQELSLV